MDVHLSRINGRPAFLLLDAQERVVEQPTNFLRSLSRGPSNRAFGTLKLYAGQLREFCQFLHEHPYLGQLDLDETFRALDISDLDDFYLACRNRGLGPATVRGYEVVLRLFTAWLTTAESGPARSTSVYEGSGYRTTSPTKRVPRFLTVDEVISLLKGMNWEAQRLITHFMFDTGLRVSEVPRVLKSDLPSAETYPSDQMYFPLFVRGSKGRGGQIKERYTLISRPMLVRVRRYFRSRSYFTNHDWPECEKPAFLNTQGGAISVAAIKKFVATAAARRGLQAWSHRLRHGMAFSVLRSEHGRTLMDNLVVLQRALGHSSITTTEIYAHIPAPVLERVQAKGSTENQRYRFEEGQRILDQTYLLERDEPRIRSRKAPP